MASLSTTLFSKTRRAVLAILLGQPEQAFFLREVVRTANVGQGTVQRELTRLAQAGIIRRIRRGRQVFFQANPHCPVYAELRGIIMKTAGLGDVLRQALGTLQDRVRIAFIFGSVARNEDRLGSDVDLCVVGEVGFGEVVAALTEAQTKLAREINVTVYPTEEFSGKLKAEHHFVTQIVRGPKWFIFGDERDLAGLGT